MSIQNGVNEIYEQFIQLRLKNKSGEIFKENWKIPRNDNITPLRYDFVKEISLNMHFECENLDFLKSKFQASIQEKLENDELTLVEIINDTGDKILTLEDQKGLLNQVEIFSIKESLVFCE